MLVVACQLKKSICLTKDRFSIVQDRKLIGFLQNSNRLIWAL